MALHISTVRDGLAMARVNAEKRLGPNPIVPGLGVPGGLAAILPVFINGFMLSGNTDLRQNAGELTSNRIEVLFLIDCLFFCSSCVW